jgi:hypothetical protein
VRETPIKDKIAAWLKKQPGVWFFKVHGSAMQAAGIPDFVGCWRGRFFGLEVKVPGRTATKLQARTLELIASAGGIAGVVTSVDEAAACLAALDEVAP